MAVDQPPSRWLLTLSGGYPDGIWCCSACMAPLTEGVITHEGGCPDSAPAIRAAERERIRQLVIKHDARTLQRCDGSGNCAGQVHVIKALSKRAAAGGHWVPFADLIGDE